MSLIKLLIITLFKIMNEVIKIIEHSFMIDLLQDENISDISYNGKDIYYFSASKGRCYYKSIDQETVFKLLRNIADHSNKRFSFTDVFLDISVGKYRLSAMHHAQSRHGFEPGISFALRINHNFIAKHKDYVGNELKTILQEILRMKRSIVISGPTGVGKTTLQKYLISLLPDFTRIVVIDNVMELAEVNFLNEKLDITLWQTNTTDEYEINLFVQRALRFHPDFLIIAESRGGEMREIIQGAISGHPNIITIHADNENVVYDRIAYLAKLYVDKTLFRAYPYIIQLSKKDTKNGIVRYISKIVKYDESSDKRIVIYEEKL